MGFKRFVKAEIPPPLLQYGGGICFEKGSGKSDLTPFPFIWTEKSSKKCHIRKSSQLLILKSIMFHSTDELAQKIPYN